MNTIAAPVRASRTGPAAWLIVSQAVMLVSLLPWAFLGGLTVVSSGARQELLPGPLMVVLWIYPILPLACSIAAWRAFRRGDLRRAKTLTTVPLALAVPLLAFFAYLAMPVG